MSIARFGPASDLYLYVSASSAGLVVECCGCRLLGGPWPDHVACRWLTTWPEFLLHVAMHEDAGHLVPRTVYADAIAELKFCGVWHRWRPAVPVVTP